MIIVDDKLSLDALAGRYHRGEQVATTWSFHYRLLRALTDETRWGALSRYATPDLRSFAAAPPSDRLLVLDPRVSTSLAAEFAVDHGLNLLAAELMAAGLLHQAAIHLSAANVGREWPEIMASLGLALTVV